MAIKVDQQYSVDENGQLLLGDVSWVNCSDEDPYRVRGTEGQRYVTIEKSSATEKEQA